MLLLDRYILVRFTTNFALLFLLLFIFGAAIDVILGLDRFVDVARLVAGPDGGVLRFSFSLVGLIIDYQAPRLFQFYAYLHGLVAIGAMGFTLAQMHRHRELVAVMASGVSLYRVAMPFLIGVFALSIAQLFNQEMILPRDAPLLLRDYGQIGQHSVDSFDLRFTPDGKKSLFQSPSYDPQTQTMVSPTILERDDRGRTVRRITAASATWSEPQNAWALSEGLALWRVPDPQAGEAESGSLREPIGTYATDLTPQVIMVRRFNQFAAMLSLNQISQMLDTPMLQARDALLRYRYSRFSSVLVSLLVLALTLPSFLLREPANLLRQSVQCAALAVPATVGSAIGMMVEMPGISPAVGVFLPVIVLGFMSLFPWTHFKT